MDQATDHPVLQMLSSRFGLAFRPNQLGHTLESIETAMRRHRAPSPERYLMLLERDEKAMDELIVELTVGETYFFREIAHFQHLRDRVLPDLRQRKGNDHSVRIWSAACASGEEIYSIAMLCYVAGLGSRVQLLGTDVSSEALTKARRAVYRPWSFRGEGAALAKPHLHTLDEQHFEVAGHIRTMVDLEFLNLATDKYPDTANGTSQLDVIFCRNVLIYFHPEMVTAVASRLVECLAPGGWLITASGDPSLDRLELETVVTDDGVFYRRPETSNETSSGLSDSDTVIFERETVGGDLSDGTDEETLYSSAEETRPNCPTMEDTIVRVEDSFASLDELLEAASRALESGDYRRAALMTEAELYEPRVSILHIKSLSNLSVDEAELKCQQILKQHPMAAELHHLHAMLLMDLNRNDEAFRAAQRAVHLDGGLAMAHFTSGSILHRQGRLREARLSFRNVIQLCSELAPDTPVSMADGETMQELAEAAESHLKLIQKSIRGRRG